MHHTSSRVTAAAQRGASMAEFIVVAPVLLLLGFGVVQLGLILHGRTILNYATFEAARTGAVNHALPEPMRRELAVRLAPTHGGDGSAAKAAEAIARSVVDLRSPLGPDGAPRPMTTVELLNPSPAAFADWGVHDPVADRTVIPNSHLRHRHRGEAPGDSGMSLSDANILEIEVTHGFELTVPVVGRVLTTALALVDPENAVWYAANRLPLSSVATVRMQSDAWLADDESLASVVPDAGEDAGENAVTGADDAASDDGSGEPGDGTGAAGAGEDGDGENGGASDAEVDGRSGDDETSGGAGGATGEVCGDHGLGGVPVPVSEATYLSDGCGIDGQGHAPPDGPDIFGRDEAVPPSSARGDGC